MANYKGFQNDEDWLSFRANYFTASEIYKLLSDPKDKTESLSVGAKSYVLECVAEMLAPSEPQFYNSAMERGNEVEPRVAERIAKELGKTVNDDDFIYTSVGERIFFYNDEYDLGSTPDVIILNNMICEVKCPKSKTHLKYLMIKSLDDFFSVSKSESPSSKDSLKKYYGQMQLNMFLTETDKCLFVSFDDRYYNPLNHYHTVEIPRDEAYIKKLLEKANHGKEYKYSILNKLDAKQ
ncbi:YqaJ viral recombinase family protein [Chryseobacterium sp. SN22]|uniref:YqaJ viral recombinase family protein n=1 Tax=Chryseobacterium sp. SN22 TaxID=2606431 RepID=UPI00162A5E9E|nr:YqaJ viral recombinase family protein [Chryseobacterium sp. SN22]